ncbi:MULTISPECIES: hypothetical protein [Bacillus cereus group]|uniref:Uncharacterized protein n=1 Tax=Bacillus thuringiensis TaxID=1428 RepID=A0AB36TMT4_BACTU|nr:MULTISPECIES: hypothetical protein [Bacillus cereus group]EJQ22307.1 hypothetical protein IE9_05359 [Bacillus cereus BAG4X12-1]EOP78344.1 hypothetical protein IEG_05228 [Bacillus cereus BAG5X12-1]MBV6709063.1 hypothetical protein [Bacillus thuringiensis]MEB9365559.1 hypothetical protein [Bacillus cereus]PES44704.1 hypothetical protein CN515_30200 [Bacillus cereus]
MKISSNINNRFYPLNTTVVNNNSLSTTTSRIVNNNQKYIPESKTRDNQLSEKNIEQHINNKYNAINSQGLSIFEILKMLLDKGVPMSMITEILVGMLEGHSKKNEEAEKGTEKGTEKELVKGLEKETEKELEKGTETGLVKGISNIQKE